MEDNKPVQNPLREIVDPFVNLIKAPRALWGINLSYLLEGITYFGILSLLAMYFNDLGLNDIQAGQMVGIQTAGITLAMLFLGATVDWIGVRKALLISLSTMLVGRVLLTLAPQTGAPGLWQKAHIVAMLGILGVVLGYGIYQPACYAAVKQFTDKKTSAMGYAMLYAIMNLGGFLPGLISPPIRKNHGIVGVYWVYVALTVAGILVVAFILSKKTVEMAIANAREGQDEPVSEPETNETQSTKEKIVYYLKNFPVKDGRFMFFIFILIPVQTLFAHNWLTLPMYFERAFSGVVSNNFEFFVNFNPILIFILAPMVAALTAQKDTYKMMILGTTVMALPTFLLAIGPNIYSVFGYLIIMTIGEAIWQPRFLQWVAEIAPKNMTGIYMGIGQFPWFLTKVITSLYSGWFLTKYCPAGVTPEQTNTETMWLIYGFIAIISPIALLIARKWMGKGLEKQKA
ncbi:MAG TPA: MFS transporter [Candidatus Marinimicrobia bacterium]|jgi:MFS family permease|nr:MFS transporter [Candidatus Neomarinimicrobiota bacterium]HOU16878.1 MFS transporter [Candidatus Neomarinimicrobiota bacterium]HQC62236.1 MFS transporter [Candidatus Neomarinimicrobiota bacterium]HQE94923.1 MFS transporter [Candidatus Neomarinimicrobiota bacterium]HQH55642.1 MFS transporter [Candidatus Neomarinimicrobiota bacterium]